MKNIILIFAICIALGAGFGLGYSIRGSVAPATTHVMGNTMDNMTADLEGKTGDDFDKAFLSGMIVHHEGAVEMAKAAQVSAKHPEIKQMAGAIITAQASEIGQMKEWQKTWYRQ